MKALIVLLSLSFSASVFAHSIADSSVLTSMAPTLSIYTTFGETEFNARKIMDDAQEVIQGGEMSPYLGQKIREIQESQGSSESEALDFLMSESESILAK